jgi:type II restriction/modification system DNA methylase subunit YeeA
MNTTDLKNFAQNARRQLREQVAARMEQVLQTDSAEIREQAQAIQQLREQITQSSKAAVIDKAAYTWFNRFCALRFMDVRNYNRVRAVSPQEGFTQPEILQEAKQGIIDEGLPITRQQVFDLFNGRLPSRDPQGEAYRLLLVGVCNQYHQAMPFLFEEIADYTELLMPEDLLSENSVLQAARQALTLEACEDVEVIGWLYQYYISERKDEVFAALKKRKKIEAEDIPAATQLFTPHWIVRYLVENSLGRLWMFNNPNSRLIEQMEFYIRPEEPETNFLQVASPEELKICDPACGSGHMLTYAFDLLYAIYEEQGYDPVQIPQLILQKNLYGIEIDQRAGHLAAFALTMKARERDRRFFTRKVEPNICVLCNVSFTASEIDEYMQAVGRDLFTQDLWLTLRQFEQAENFGSLIRPALKDVAFIRDRLEEKGVFGNMFLHNTNQKVTQVLEMAEYLSSRYHVVVANPPYMGRRNMEADLRQFLSDEYKDAKSDLFSAFIIRILKMLKASGSSGLMTPFTWMFLSTYEILRETILENTLVSLVRPEYHAFFDSAYVPICGFVVIKNNSPNYKGAFIDLNDFYGTNLQPIKTLEAIRNQDCDYFYRSSANDFKKIPGSPIAYWVSENVREVFEIGISLGKIASPRQGLATADNDRFLRLWQEVSFQQIGFGYNSRDEAKNSNKKWFPYNKGGEFRKWYGNNEYVVNWKNDGYEICNFFDGGKLRSRPQNTQYYFRASITWSFVSSSYFGVRYSDVGAIFDVGGSSVFPVGKDIYWLTGFLCSKLSTAFLKIVNPTLNFQVGNIASLPIIEPNKEITAGIAQEIITITRSDWDSYETSWNFDTLPMLRHIFRSPVLEDTYNALSTYWEKTIQNAKLLEEKNNQVFIEAYNLQDEIASTAPLDKITLSCNPHYRYGGNRSGEELEALLLTDTMKEFINYAVGCMFGRYSIDKPGLVLANQGETLRDYLKQIPEPTFPADDDNVIPVLDEGWFDDDIVERFKRFLRVTFGDEHYEENLAFLENAIGKDLRSYFLRDFYSEHVKMYKKRPIYWLFSSPQGSFNALIYMHRYRPDTVSIILNDYLREYSAKISSQKAQLQAVERSPSASQGEKTKALREIDKINKILAELREYEDEILYPLATQQIDIDLDDGVLVNYPKFGAALKKVSGLS